MKKPTRRVKAQSQSRATRWLVGLSGIGSIVFLPVYVAKMTWDIFSAEVHIALAVLGELALLSFFIRHYARPVLDDLTKVTQFVIELARSFVSRALSIRRALKSASTFIGRTFPEGRHGDDLKRQFRREREPTASRRSSDSLGEFAYSQIIAGIVLMVVSSGFASYFAYQIARLDRQQIEAAREPLKKGDFRRAGSPFDERYNLCDGADCGIGGDASVCDHRTIRHYLSFSFFCAKTTRQLDLLD